MCPKAINFLSEKGTGDSRSEGGDSGGCSVFGGDSPDDMIDGVLQADSSEDDGDADAP